MKLSALPLSIVAALGLAVAPYAAAQTLPTRLVQASDLVYEGSFTFANAPATCAQGTFDFEYVQGVTGFNPANNSLFVAGHGVCQSVAEWRVPAIGGVAALLQSPVDVTGGKLAQINSADPNSKAIGGLLVIGDRLVATGYSTYDGSGTATASHFVRSTTLTSGTTTGPFRVGALNPAFYAGHMGAIPAVWQAALGGDVLTGQCCLSIISRTSFGPSASAVNSADLVAARNPTSATMLVGYPEGHLTLGPGTVTGAVFSLTDELRGVVLPEGTASVLFFGLHGTGAYCYGEVPTQCTDPANSYKGGHAYPYVPYVWAFRAADFADVKAGRKQPWDVTPYATFRLPSQILNADIGGATYDPATGRLFIIETYGGPNQTPRAHILTISGAGTTPPPTGDTTAPSVAVSAPTGGTLSGTVTFSATASDAVGVASVWFTVDGATVGAEDTSAPHQTSWNSATVANGTHTIRAVARDAAGNTATSGAVTVTVSNTSGSTPPPAADPPGWTLDWADEFTGTAVNTADWNVISGVGSYGGTQQTFAPANVTVSNGLLRLQARKEGSGARPFTSGAVTTQNKRTFAPEFRLEVRAQLPVFRGVWSMIWTREGTMPTPDVGVEIDVMENIGDASVSYFTLHRWNGASNQTVAQCAPYKPGYDTAMHTFAVEVVGGKTTWFLDGVQMCGPANDAPTLASYLIMDLAIGGTWGGTADVNQAMPQNMDIDYVRIYRRSTGGGTTDTTAPTVSLTAPTASATVSGTVAVAATAADNVGVASVQFTLNGVNLGAADTSAPYTINWSTTGAANGAHVLGAVARDAAGNSTTTTRTVTVSNATADTTAPTVSLTAPAASATVSGTVAVAATAADNVGVTSVQFTLNGVTLGAADTAAPYTINWSTTGAANGVHVLGAVARDAAGNQASTTRSVTVSNQAATGDTTLPSVSLVSPTTGMTTSGDMVIEASASDNAGVAGVRFTVNGVTVGTEVTSAPYRMTWNTRTVANGAHGIQAVARDTAGNIRWTPAATVTVNNSTGGSTPPPAPTDTTAPTVSVTGPSTWRTQSGFVTLSASATDNVGVVSVKFLVNGTIVGSTVTAAPYLLSWNSATIDNGTHTLTAVAVDAAGNTTTSASRSLRVNNTAEAQAAAQQQTGSDLNGDERPDLLFQQATGQIYGWFMNGTTRIGEGATSPSMVGPLWKAVSLNDFNKDGKADIVWQYQPTGQLAIWILDGMQLTIETGIASGVSSSWKVASTGDVNGDGHTDIIWQDPVTGFTKIWLMYYWSLVSEVGVSPYRADPLWRLGASADFNSDGRDDLVWQHRTTGEVTIWYMGAGGNVASSSATLSSRPSDPSWSIRSADDYDGNGSPDLVWQHSNGQIQVWMMSGSQVLRQDAAPTPADPNWRVVGGNN